MLAEKQGIWETSVAKWGNSQGIHISKRLCEQVGIQTGDRVQIALVEDGPEKGLLLTPRINRYHRNKKISIEEFLADHQGSTYPSDDPWGSDVGAEVVL
jgi:antitoxin component of MazEF toxin-antitoxin module